MDFCVAFCGFAFADATFLCVVVDLVVVVTLVAAWALTVRPVAITNAVSVVANFFIIFSSLLIARLMASLFSIVIVGS